MDIKTFGHFKTYTIKTEITFIIKEKDFEHTTEGLPKDRWYAEHNAWHIVHDMLIDLKRKGRCNHGHSHYMVNSGIAKPIKIYTRIKKDKK